MVKGWCCCFDVCIVVSGVLDSYVVGDLLVYVFFDCIVFCDVS